MRGLGPVHFKQQELPLARIKKIMKVKFEQASLAGLLCIFLQVPLSKIFYLTPSLLEEIRDSSLVKIIFLIKFFSQ